MAKRISSPFIVFRFSMWQRSLASLVMKLMNSETHSWTHSRASFAIYNSFGMKLGQKRVRSIGRSYYQIQAKCVLCYLPCPNRVSLFSWFSRHSRLAGSDLVRVTGRRLCRRRGLSRRCFRRLNVQRHLKIRQLFMRVFRDKVRRVIPSISSTWTIYWSDNANECPISSVFSIVVHVFLQLNDLERKESKEFSHLRLYFERFLIKSHRKQVNGFVY